MRETFSGDLAASWAALLRSVVEKGAAIDARDGAYHELYYVSVDVTDVNVEVPFIARHVPADSITEMRKVFLGGGDSKFGHAYWPIITGGSVNQLETAVRTLQKKRESRKAVIALGPQPNEDWVPCINAIHFAVVGGLLTASYFSRGQDIWNKFVPDVIAIRELQKEVARQADAPIGSLHAFLTSAHVYDRDADAVLDALREGS